MGAAVHKAPEPMTAIPISICRSLTMPCRPGSVRPEGSAIRCTACPFGAGAGLGADSGQLSSLGTRQAHRNDAAAGRCVGNLDCTAVGAHDLLCDAEAEAAATVIPALCLAAVESVEDMRQVRAAHPRTAVRHRNTNLRRARRGADPHLRRTRPSRRADPSEPSKLGPVKDG